jgi:hypothetical protein
MPSEVPGFQHLIQHKLAILLLIVIMDAHVVCNQIMTMFYSHSLLPEHELAHPFVKLGTLIFQSIQVSGL